LYWWPVVSDELHQKEYYSMWCALGFCLGTIVIYYLCRWHPACSA